MYCKENKEPRKSTYIELRNKTIEYFFLVFYFILMIRKVFKSWMDTTSETRRKSH